MLLLVKATFRVWREAETAHWHIAMTTSESEEESSPASHIKALCRNKNHFEIL